MEEGGQCAIFYLPTSLIPYRVQREGAKRESTNVSFRAIIFFLKASLSNLKLSVDLIHVGIIDLDLSTYFNRIMMILTIFG